MIVRLEGEAPTSVIESDLSGVLPAVEESLGQAEPEDLRHPEAGLHQAPGRHTAVAGHGVEVEVAVQAVSGPPDTPHCVTVLPIGGV